MIGVWTLVLAWTGAAFMLLAAIGILRLPDIFMRMQAATKAGTLGISLMMLAAAAHFAEVSVTARVIGTVLFLFATAPVGAHVIARAAHLRNARLWRGTSVDELRRSYGGTHPPPPAPAGTADDRHSPEVSASRSQR